MYRVHDHLQSLLTNCPNLHLPNHLQNNDKHWLHWYVNNDSFVFIIVNKRTTQKPKSKQYSFEVVNWSYVLHLHNICDQIYKNQFKWHIHGSDKVNSQSFGNLQPSAHLSRPFKGHPNTHLLWHASETMPSKADQIADLLVLHSLNILRVKIFMNQFRKFSKN